NPALLYDLAEDQEKLVYKEENEKVFYDSMEFWNETEGIAIGDPTATCMSILITRDGGKIWQKIACDKLPVANDGEAAFAASDTNIAIYGEKAWVATGGKSSRVLFTSDKGNSWSIYDTPIIQGKETTGIYSIDFYDEKVGFAIGGDYTDPDSNEANKIRTTDGGKNWETITGGPGYRSCVQYIPGSEGSELVVVGFKGIDYSQDGGLSWTHLSNEGFYTIRFLNDSTAFAAGKGRVAKLMFK
ncbi:MAG: oxidoreductase, partial [Bacteroidia bacterium]|nr:oxidoreductase [Bacteroidia bacterium]